MNTRTASREAREQQLLLAAIRQMARSRSADHTLGALLLAGASAAFYLVAVALGVVWTSPPPLSSGTTYLLAGGWLVGFVGLAKSALALAQPNGTKWLAGFAFLVTAALTAGPLVALALLL